MRIDGAIFAIEERTIGGCLDLAVVFVREHLTSILKLLLWFALPSIALTWWLVDSQDWTLSGSLFLFLLESPFCGTVLTICAGRRVFGEKFSVGSGFRHFFKRFFVFSALMITARLITIAAGFFLILPAYLVATRYGFLAEIFYLEGCPLKRYEGRLTDLMNANFMRLFGRLLTVMAFYSMTVTSLFFLVDLASGTLFGYPILSGRITSFEYMDREIATLLTRDPRVATVLVTICWLVYPITRLAWMFCYLDLRIRQEGWDIELDFRIEAQRLEALS